VSRPPDAGGEETAATRGRRALRAGCSVCLALALVGLGLLVYVGVTAFTPHMISRVAAERNLGLRFPAEVAVRAAYEAPPPPGFCMAEARMSPAQFRQFTTANDLRWRKATRADEAVQRTESMGASLLHKMRVWHPSPHQPLLVDDQRVLAYNNVDYTHRWVRRAEIKAHEFTGAGVATLLGYREPTGDMIVLCFKWG
jgi:hypothetical protein